MRFAGLAARALAPLAVVLLFATCEPLTAPGPAGEVVLSFGADSVLVARSRVAPAIAVTVGGAPLPRARLRFESSDSGVVSVTASGDTLVAVGRGRADVTVRLVSAVAAHPTPSLVQAVYVVAKRIELTRTSATLSSLGDTVRLAGSAFDAADEIIGDATFSWSSSDVSVASVSASGLVTARRNGVAIIRAGIGTERNADSATVTVQQRLVRFALSPLAVTLDAVGAQATIAAEGRDRADSTIAGAAVATWTSDNPTVATVGTDGRILARGDGTTRVIATAGAVSDTVGVTVRQQATAVSMFAPGGEGSPATGFRVRSLRGTLLFSATGRDRLGTELARAVPVWTSAAPRVARIDTLGLVTALDTGTAQIVARIDGAADTVAVRVTNDPAGISVLLADTARLSSVGDTLVLRARVLNGRGDSIPGAPVTWSTPEVAVLRVRGDSLVGVGVGLARAIATAGSAADTAFVRVSNVPATMAIVPEAVAMTAVGDSLLLPTVIETARGVVVAPGGVAWVSRREGVARVSGGLVVARDTGEVVVVATSGVLADSVTVVVRNLPDAVQADRDALALTAVGRTAPLAAEVRNRRGVAMPGHPVSWRALDAAVATVAASGVVTGAGVGTGRVVAEVTSALGGRADTVLVTVRDSVASIATVPDAATLTSVGDELALRATVRNPLLSVVAGAPVAWRSLDPAVVRVSADTAYALGVGVARVTATADGGAVADTLRITVSNEPTAVLMARRDTVLASVGDGFDVAVAITNARGGALGRDEVVWSTTDTTKVGVGPTGFVTARARGFAVVRAVHPVNTAVRDSIRIEVTNAPASVEASVSHDTLVAIGASRAYVATIRNGRGRILPDDSVAWRVEPTTVATVDAAGLVRTTTVGAARVIVEAGAGSGVVADTVLLESRSIAKTVSIVSPALDVLLTARGSGLTMVAQGRDSLGTVAPAGGVKWRSGNAFVARADSLTGVVVATGVGSTLITVEAPGGASDTRRVTVEDRAARVNLIDASRSIPTVGDTYLPAIEIRNANDSLIADRASVAWSSSDTSIVRVTTSGLVTAVAFSAVPVYVIAASASTLLRDSVEIMVTNQPASLDIRRGAVSVGVVTLDAITAVDTLSAVARNGGGVLLPGEAVTWRRLDPAVVSVDADGIVRAEGVGTDTVIATAVRGGVADTVVVVVRQVAGSVTALPGDTTLTSLRHTYAVRATAFDLRGTAIPGTAVTFGTTNAFVASVHPTTGLVTAVGVGTATITASVSGVPGATATVRIENRPDSVFITEASRTLASVGEVFVPTVRVNNQVGDAITGGASLLTWQSADPSVVSVTASGTITAVGATSGGPVYVRAFIPADVSRRDSVLVTVTNAVSTLAVLDTLLRPIASDSVHFTSSLASFPLAAVARNARGDVVAGAATTWSTTDGAVATVSATGRVTAVGDGRTVITATSGTASGQVAVRVRRAARTVTATPTPLALDAVSATQALVATARDSAGAAIAGAAVRWSSDNTGIATVGGTTGLVTAVAPGVAGILAAVPSIAGATDSVRVTVPTTVTNAVASVDLTPTTATFTSLLTSQTPAATILNRLGASLGRTSALWTSDDASVATVTAAGVITAVGAGSAHVKIVSPQNAAVRDSLLVTVVNAPTAAFVTPPAPALTAVGRSTPLAAAATNALGAVVPDAVFTWSTSDGLVASVSATGVVTGAGTGTATITARTSDRVSAGTIAGTATVTVRNDPVAVEIVPDSVTITSLTGTLSVSATVRNDLGAVVAGAPTWRTRDAGVATVNASGLVTGHAVGATWIVADTLNGAVRIGDSLRVAVRNLAASVALTPDLPDSLTFTSLEDVLTIAATIRNELGAALADRRAVTWTSDDPAVATVSATGDVTARATGRTLIRAVAPVGSATSTDSVRVHVRNDAATVTVTTSGAPDTLAAPGQQLAYSAVARNARGAIVPDAAISWSSSASGVVSASPTGSTTTATLVSYAGTPVTLTASAPTGSPGTVSVAAVDPTTLYVSDSTITGPRLGTRKRPFQRIGDAVAIASAGDTVFVRRGVATYTESVAISVALTLAGDSAAFVAGGRADSTLLPIIRHAAGGAAISSTTGGALVVRGLTVRHDVAGAAIDATGASSVTIDQVYVNPTGARGATPTGAGFRVTGAGSVTVRSSAVRRAVGFGLRVDGTPSVTVSRLSVDSVEAGGGGDGAGVSIGGASTGVSITGSSVRGAVQAVALRNVAAPQVADDTLAGTGTLLRVAGGSGAGAVRRTRFTIAPGVAGAALHVRDSLSSHPTLDADDNVVTESGAGGVMTGVELVGVRDVGATRGMTLRRTSFTTLLDAVVLRGATVHDTASTIDVAGAAFRLAGAADTLLSERAAVTRATLGCVAAEGAGGSSGAARVRLHGAQLAGCSSGSRAAVVVDNVAAALSIEDSRITTAGTSAVDFAGASLTLASDTLSGGGTIAASGDPLDAAVVSRTAAAVVSVTGTLVRDFPSRIGLRLVQPSATVTGSVFARNAVGVQLTNAPVSLTLTGNDVFDNATAGAVNLPAVKAHVNNFWGDSLGPRRFSSGGTTDETRAAGDSANVSGSLTLVAGDYLVAPAASAGSGVVALRIVRGDSQSVSSAGSGSLAALPLVVRAVDSQARPVSGTLVTFTALDGDDIENNLSSSNPSATSQDVTTGSDGLARIVFQARGTGKRRVAAKIGSTTLATFTITGTS